MFGCTATFKGRPDRIIPDEVITNDIATITSIESLRNCNEIKTKDCRNRIIYATILGIDMNYHNFEMSLFNDDRKLSFASTLASLGLTAASAYTGAPVLAAISTGVIGADSAYGATILQGQLQNTLQNQMSAQRNTVKARIFTQTELTFDEYPLNLASIDLENLYNAGTINAAMKNLSTVASTNAVNASKTLQAVNPNNLTGRE